MAIEFTVVRSRTNVGAIGPASRAMVIAACRERDVVPVVRLPQLEAADALQSAPE
jgi:hypothetical protein